MKITDKLGLFAGGVLFGSLGIKLLTGAKAKKVYAHTVAAALKAKDCVMTTATKIKENADDIVSDAKEMNAKNEAEENEVIG